MTVEAPVAPRARATFNRLTVASVEPLTSDSVAVTFEVPADLAEAYTFRPGQHLTIRSDHGAPNSRRSYSIASPAGGPLRVGIKRLPGGAFSEWAVHDLRPGMQLDVMTPMGEFGTDLQPGTPRHHVALAAGSGITPVFSIVASVLAAEPASTMTLLYGSRGSAQIMFGEELADLKDSHPARFQLLHFLSREPQASPLRAGRLDAAKLDGVLGPLVPLDADAWYLCGPNEAVGAWSDVLTARGVEASRINRELFHAGPLPARPVLAAPIKGPHRTVFFTLDGRSGEIEISPEETVLDGVLRLRPDAPFACRGGVCGTCRATVNSGTVEMDANFALEPDELERGFVLTCQARPTSDEVTVDFDPMNDPLRVADAVTHAMMLNDRASNAAGIVLRGAAPGEVTVEMTVAKEHVNGFDICHGGVLFLLADTAFALCCNSHGPQTVAAGGDITFCRPAAVGETLTAHAVERTRFGRSGLYDVTVTRGDGAIVAEFRGRSRTIGETQPGADGTRITERTT